MTNREKVIRGLRDIDMFIAGRLEHEKAKNFLRTIDETIALLKEQKGLMLALEQSNAVNGFLNAEVERLNGLLKEQEERLCKLQKDKDKLCIDVSEWRHKYYDRPLKEKEAVKPKIDAFGHPYCPKCKILVYERWEFCPHCGRAMKW